MLSKQNIKLIIKRFADPQVEVCDATEDDNSTNADQIKIIYKLIKRMETNVKFSTFISSV